MFFLYALSAVYLCQSNIFRLELVKYSRLSTGQEGNLQLGQVYLLAPLHNGMTFATGSMGIKEKGRATGCVNTCMEEGRDVRLKVRLARF